MKQNRTRRMPDTYVIIFFVVVIAALLTWIVPAGKFETHQISYMLGATEKTRNVLIPESFTYELDAAGNPLVKGVKLFEPGGGTGFFNYAFEGLCSGSKWGSAVGVVAFILIIGGAFGIILRTGSVEVGMKHMIAKTKGMDKLIIPVLFFLFSLGGAVFGMGEEAIPFVFIIAPIMIALGYDTICAVMVTYCATQIGFGTSWMNPFSVAIAQGIAEIPVLSASGFRMFMWVFFTGLGAFYTYHYAQKIRKNPELSPAVEANESFRAEAASDNTSDTNFGTGDMLVILTIVLGIIWTIWGVLEEGYYIPEIATQFFIMGIVSGIIGVLFKLNDMTVNDIATSFKSGSSDLLTAAMVVGIDRKSVV